MKVEYLRMLKLTKKQRRQLSAYERFKVLPFDEWRKNSPSLGPHGSLVKAHHAYVKRMKIHLERMKTNLKAAGLSMYL
jgi:hypothetical protein